MEAGTSPTAEEPVRMPATDRRVLEAMAMTLAECWPRAEIASAAGVMDSSVPRVIRRLRDGGYIRRFEPVSGERLEGWVLTPEGREAVR